MARAALLWNRRRLGDAAGLSERDVARFERGARVEADEIRRMRLSLEAEGIEFLADEGIGPGVRLRASHEGDAGIRPDQLSAANDG